MPDHFHKPSTHHAQGQQRLNRQQRRAQAAQQPGHPRIAYQADEVDPAWAATVLAHSAAMDLVSGGDRNWFKANPGRSYRLRLLSDPEAATIHGRAAPETGMLSYVVVRQFKPGARSRFGLDAYPFNRPENFSDAVCAMLFDEIMVRNPKAREIVEVMLRMARA